jgi:hypothetical protein
MRNVIILVRKWRSHLEGIEGKIILKFIQGRYGVKPITSITAHNQWLHKTRSISDWTTMVFSSTATDLVLIYKLVTTSLPLSAGQRSTAEHSTSHERIRTETLNSLELNWTLKWWLPQSQSYVTTDSQSVSLSWYKAPMWGLRPDLYFCQTVAGLLICGALSDERTGLSFARRTVQ